MLEWRDRVVLPGPLNIREKARVRVRVLRILSQRPSRPGARSTDTRVRITDGACCSHVVGANTLVALGGRVYLDLALPGGCIGSSAYVAFLFL